MDGKFRRYAMIPVFGMVILPQNLSTGNGQHPGWSSRHSERSYGQGAVEYAEYPPFVTTQQVIHFRNMNSHSLYDMILWDSSWKNTSYSIAQLKVN